MVVLPQSIVMTYFHSFCFFCIYFRFPRERGNEAISWCWWGWNFPHSLQRINQVCHWFLLGTINQVQKIGAQTDHPILVDSNGSSVWGFSAESICFGQFVSSEAVGMVQSYRNHQVWFLISMNNVQQGRIQIECWNVVKLWLILFGDSVKTVFDRAYFQKQTIAG